MLPIFEQANKLNEAGKFDEAAELYDQLLTQNHDHPMLLATQATILMRNSKTIGLAITLFHSSMEKMKGVIPSELYSNLGLAYKYSGQIDKAKHFMEKAVNVNPTAGALTTYGALFVESAESEKAREHLEHAIRLEPSLAMAHWNLSLCILGTANENGDWGRGWDEYEWGKLETGMRILKKNVDLPDWDGTPGKKVIVCGEQGIGDEIMFASMLPEIMKTNEVILDCHPRLTTLFSRSFNLKCYGTRKDKELDWIKKEKPDYLLPVGSLGKFYRRTRDSFTGAPYLDAEATPRGKKFRVGISWTGGKSLQRVARRTVPLSWWQSIFANDCEFVSLQYTDGCEKEIEICNKSHGTSITQHPSAKAEDYYELAKVVKSCDLIITVCTSLVHLAGALGVPTWVMVPKHPAWRYQRSGRMPWYRSVRLYRQPEAEDGAWIPVLQTIGLDLENLVKGQMRKVA